MPVWLIFLCDLLYKYIVYTIPVDLFSFLQMQSVNRVIPHILKELILQLHTEPLGKKGHWKKILCLASNPPTLEVWSKSGWEVAIFFVAPHA